MPAYRFDLVSATERLLDLRSVEAMDDEHAMSDALAAIREIAQEGPQSSWIGWSLEIYETESNRLVFNIPLSHFAVEVFEPPAVKDDSALH